MEDETLWFVVLFYFILVFIVDISPIILASLHGIMLSHVHLCHVSYFVKL